MKKDEIKLIIIIIVSKINSFYIIGNQKVIGKMYEVVHFAKYLALVKQLLIFQVILPLEPKKKIEITIYTQHLPLCTKTRNKMWTRQ